MAGDWISFIAGGDPKRWKRRNVLKSLQAEVPAWTAYRSQTLQIFVYEGNATNVMETDN